jgi:ketosteroid isomerase-like protein
MNTCRILLLAGILLAPSAHAQQGGRSDPSLAARIQRLEDLEVIRAVLLEYGRTLDAHDFAAYSRLFAADGEWVGGLGSVKGPAAIQAFMEKNIGAGPNTAHTYHLLSNFVIDVRGDTATAWSRWAYVTPGADGKPVIAQGGHYDDTFVRENGHWKFKRRVAASDLPRPNAQAK